MNERINQLATTLGFTVSQLATADTLIRSELLDTLNELTTAERQLGHAIQKLTDATARLQARLEDSVSIGALANLSQDTLNAHLLTDVTQLTQRITDLNERAFMLARLMRVPAAA